MNHINNGDIWDIGQTVNGISTFLFINNKWYYIYSQLEVRPNKDHIRIEIEEYNYDYDGLVRTITGDYNSETKLLDNIFENKLQFDFSKCPIILESIRDFKINKIL